MTQHWRRGSRMSKSSKSVRPKLEEEVIAIEKIDSDHQFIRFERHLSLEQRDVVSMPILHVGRGLSVLIFFVPFRYHLRTAANVRFLSIMITQKKNEECSSADDS